MCLFIWQFSCSFWGVTLNSGLSQETATQSEQAPTPGDHYWTEIQPKNQGINIAFLDWRMGYKVITWCHITSQVSSFNHIRVLSCQLILWVFLSISKSLDTQKLHQKLWGNSGCSKEERNGYTLSPNVTRVLHDEWVDYYFLCLFPQCPLLFPELSAFHWALGLIHP